MQTSIFRWMPVFPGCRLVLVLAAGFTLAAAAENGEWRIWRSAAGVEIDAKLVSKGVGEATLEKRDGKRITVKFGQLSAGDQQFLGTTATGGGVAAPVKTGETSISGLAATPGTTSGEITCKADPRWAYYLYLPKDFHTGRLWPACFVMDSGGGAAGSLNRYIPAAEHLGIILAVSKQSKNEFWDSDLAMMAMLKDVYERVPVLENLAISSGMSGGSRMAYLMAEMEKNVAGVLACGSGGGVYLKESDFRAAKLRRGTVICSLIGTNDFNRREAVKSHKTFNSASRFIWFPGKHEWAGPELILEGLSHVYGKVLLNSKDPRTAWLRAEFAKKQLAWARERQQQTPWETYRWAVFLGEFTADGAIRNEAVTLASSLANLPEVKRSLKADKMIESFAGRYFSDGDTRADKTEDPAREKDAEKKAVEFEGLPQAELLKKMGGPAA